MDLYPRKTFASLEELVSFCRVAQAIPIGEGCSRTVLRAYALKHALQCLITDSLVCVFSWFIKKRPKDAWGELVVLAEHTLHEGTGSFLRYLLLTHLLYAISRAMRELVGDAYFPLAYCCVPRDWATRRVCSFARAPKGLCQRTRTLFRAWANMTVPSDPVMRVEALFSHEDSCGAVTREMWKSERRFEMVIEEE